MDRATSTTDVRLAVFDMLYRDTLLRPLLVHHADRLEGRVAARGTAAELCFLVLRWSGADPPRSPADTQVLTARAHLPAHFAEHRYLEAVLQRVDDVLHSRPPTAVTIRRLGTPRRTTDADDGTICAARAYEVGLAARRRLGEALLDLPEWTEHVGAAAVPAAAPGAERTN